MQDEQDEEPLSKKLRCSDPDLKIIVKYTNKKNEENEKEYLTHGVLMANLSQFIDAALSVEMRENSTREITMHVDSLDVYEKALMFQQDWSAVRLMTTQDAVNLVEFYDKYSFSGGLKLCDDILSDFLQKNTIVGHDAMTPPDDLDLLVDATVTAFQFNLPKARCLGIACMWSRLRCDTSPYGRIMFSVEHIRKLHPMFKQGVLHVPLSKEERDSPLFPKWFVEKSLNQFTSELYKVAVVSGTHSSVDGPYRFSFLSEGYVHMSAPVTTDFYLYNDYGGDWNIAKKDGDDRVVLWTCPCSGNLPVPPVGPWVAVDKVAKKRGTPKISYKSD